MNKKFARIGKKSGLKEREIRSFIKIGFSGLLAVALSAFSGSAQAGGNVGTLARQLPDKPPVTENDDCLSEKCTQFPG
ncbi:MAG: hypothetical protein PHD01_01480 [Geobacteraceae bacterium]|nr:hypothetical protein [Geobacteraceae bacterium]